MVWCEKGVKERGERWIEGEGVLGEIKKNMK